MQKALAGAIIALALFAPVAARAQASMNEPGMREHGLHEFGIDLVVGYRKPSGGSGGLALLTPVDVRLAFFNSGSLAPELRFGLALSTVGVTTYNINPGINLVYRLSGTRRHDVYGTAGADIQIIDAGPVSGIVPTINVGIGRRNPVRTTSALRAEGFAAYSLKSTKLGRPNTLSVGARLGLSFFH